MHDRPAKTLQLTFGNIWYQLNVTAKINGYILRFGYTGKSQRTLLPD